MFGHVRAGYDGYNSNPVSPTEYTVNRRQKEHERKYYKCAIPCFILFGLAVMAGVIGIIASTFFMENCKCKPEINCTLPEATREEIKGVDDIKTVATPAMASPTDLTGDHLNIGFNSSEEVEVIPSEEPPKFVNDGASQDYQPITNIRLPTNLSPLEYRIRVLPFFIESNLTTNGEVYIDFKCVNATKNITINIKELRIHEQDVQVSSSTDSKPMQISYFHSDETNEQYTIVLEDRMIPESIYNVFIKYTGQIRDVPTGLYRSYYVNPENEVNSWLVSTLFSPADARRVFPSFDEPTFKARFSFSIGRPKNYITISNTNLRNSEPIENYSDWLWDHYEETPLMATYLTAFVVAPYKPLLDYKYTSRKTNPVVNGYCKPNALHNMSFAVDMAKKILRFLEEYLGIKYPLPKLDIVAVPAQYYDAMENWGIIILRESSVFASQNSTESHRQAVAFTLAHEISHQWFGNLVTPEWWDDLWLKEGLSTYFQYLTINHIMPEWGVFDRFESDIIDSAFELDGLKTSQPISTNTKKINNEIFNTLSYHKGSFLVKMISNILGDSALKDGLLAYIKKFSYNNANKDNLWNALTTESHKSQVLNEKISLKYIMDSWTSQAGYPVVTISRDYNKGALQLTQERFLLNGEKDDSHWCVPISFITQEAGKFQDQYSIKWFNVSSMTFGNLPKNDSWILGNMKYTGYYRVNYDDDNWVLLIYAYDSFPSAIRAQLVSDSLNLARGSKLKYDITLSLVNQLYNDFDYLPWKVAKLPLNYLRNLLMNMPAYGNFRTFMQVTIYPVYERLIGRVNLWENQITNNLTAQTHVMNILTMTCFYETYHCISNSNRLFGDWRTNAGTKNNQNLIPEAIRSVVYCTAVKFGGKAEWYFVFAMYNKAVLEDDTINERARLVEALGCASEPWLLTKALGLITQEDSGLTRDEGIKLFTSVAANNIGHRIAVSFIRARWMHLLKIYNTPSVIYRMVSSIVSYINSPYDVQELNVLIEEINKTTKENSIILAQAMETAYNNMNWMNTNYMAVDKWLQNFIDKYELPS